MTPDASLPPADVQRPTPPLTEAELAEMSDKLFPEPVTLERVQWWEEHHRGPYGHVYAALIHKLARSWLELHADLRASRAEVERLKDKLAVALEASMAQGFEVERLKAENKRLEGEAAFWATR